MITKYGQVIVNYEGTGEIIITGFTWDSNGEIITHANVPLDALRLKALEWARDEIINAIVEIKKVNDGNNI